MSTRTNTNVPDFFQDDSDEALRSRVAWLEERLGLTDEFFANLVSIEEKLFRGWRDGSVGLSTEHEAILQDFWGLILHLLSFQAFDEGRVRSLFEQFSPRQENRSHSPFTPPWFGSSLKHYLESEGREAIEHVNRWIEAFRFGDPYMTLGEAKACLSIRH